MLYEQSQQSASQQQFVTVAAAVAAIAAADAAVPAAASAPRLRVGFLALALGVRVAGTGRLAGEIDGFLLAARSSVSRGVTGPAEGAGHRSAHLAGQQPAGEPTVGEFHVGQG